MASQPIYQFYSELKDYRPKIWRRFQVSENITMARLGYILMTMYEMKANHLFRLTIPIRENAKLDKPLSDSDSVFPDKVWQFEIDNEELWSAIIKVESPSARKMVK